jgi:Predicted acyltransferase
MDYEITDTITPQEYMELRQLVGWSLFPVEQAAEGLKRTTHLCCFRKEGKCIGLLRVLWDHGYVVYIADVIVRPEYQRQGLGRVLMNNALEYIRSNLKPGWRVMVSLMAAKGKEEFYKKFGFFTRPDEEHGSGMCQWIEA